MHSPSPSTPVISAPFNASAVPVSHDDQLKNAGKQLIQNETAKFREECSNLIVTLMKRLELAKEHDPISLNSTQFRSWNKFCEAWGETEAIGDRPVNISEINEKFFGKGGRPSFSSVTFANFIAHLRAALTPFCSPKDAHKELTRLATHSASFGRKARTKKQKTDRENCLAALNRLVVQGSIYTSESSGLPPRQQLFDDDLDKTSFETYVADSQTVLLGGSKRRHRRALSTGSIGRAGGKTRTPWSGSQKKVLDSLGERINKAEAALTAVQAELEDTEGAVAKQTEELARLKQDRARALKAISAVNEKRKVVQAELEAAEKRAAKIKEAACRIDAERDAKLAAITSKMEKLQQSKKKLQAEVEKANQRVETLTADLAKATHEKEDAESTIRDLKTTATMADADKTSQLSTMRANEEGLQRQIKELQESEEELKAQLKEAQEAEEAVNREAQTLRKSLLNLKGQIKSLQTDLSASEALAEKEAALAASEKQLTELNATVKALQANIGHAKTELKKAREAAATAESTKGTALRKVREQLQEKHKEALATVESRRAELEEALDKARTALKAQNSETVTASEKRLAAHETSLEELGKKHKQDTDELVAAHAEAQQDLDEVISQLREALKDEQAKTARLEQQSASSAAAPNPALAKPAGIINQQTILTAATVAMLFIALEVAVRYRVDQRLGIDWSPLMTTWTNLRNRLKAA